MRPCGVFDSRYAQDMAIVRTRTQWGLLLALLAFAVLLPFVLPGQYFEMVIIMFVTIIAMLGLNIVTGLAGQISLGQSAFMAVGAVFAGAFAVAYHLPFLAALLGGAVVAAIFGIIFGAPSLRIKGFYLALATLAAHFIILFLIHRNFFVGLPLGGQLGQLVPRPSIGGFVFNTGFRYYFLAMGITVILVFVHKNLMRTRVGRAFVAIRDNDLAAEVMGINVFRYKVLAFALSAFYAGIAGCLFSFRIGFVSTESYMIMNSIWYLGFLVVGGLGTTLGPILGAVFFRGLDEVMNIYMAPWLSGVLTFLPPEAGNGLAWVFYGLVIIVFLIYEPRGMTHRWDIFKAYYRLHPYAY